MVYLFNFAFAFKSKCKNKSIKMNTVVRMKPEIVKEIKGDAKLVAEIASVTGKSTSSVLRWLSINSELLTMLPVLTTVKGYLKVKGELTESVRVKKAA